MSPCLARPGQSPGQDGSKKASTVVVVDISQYTNLSSRWSSLESVVRDLVVSPVLITALGCCMSVVVIPRPARLATA